MEGEAIVRNQEGLHFRPIMRVVDTVSRFASRVTVQADDRTADARSPMELLMLVATCGTRLRLIADGEDAREALDALVRLIESGFGETVTNN
jgi:phosphotransferase system HPr (HPr) family protein